MKEIKLTQGKVALIDDEDYERVNKFKWYYHKLGYAVRERVVNGKRTSLLMHCFIMDTPPGMDTDHTDHNKLNNQKGNLRICSRSENQRNKAKQKNKECKYKGVIVSRRHGVPKNYLARIWVDGKYITKQFPFTPEGEVAAAQAYKAMAKRYFGEFAYAEPI